MEHNQPVQNPVLEIPGLNWKKLTLKEARQQKCFMQQEFERWTDDSEYLFQLRLTHFIPVPTDTWSDENPGAKVSVVIVYG